MANNRRDTPDSYSRNQNESGIQNDISDSSKDRQKLKQDNASLDLPDARDIPGQEHIHIPPLGELADTTISSADEEGARVFENDVEDETRIVMEAEDDEALERAMPDNKDADGDPLNERVNVSGSDLDTAIVDEDDADENIGEEDEENNTYSLGSDSEQDDGGSRG
jgi:hypothetical protein